MKKSILALLLIAVLALTGCAGKTPDAQTTAEPPPLPRDVVTQAPAMTVPTQAPLPENYDPSSEESYEEPVEGFTPTQGESITTTVTEQPSSQFAGATPILLNPIDVTNPPKQALVFTYATYAATKLGLTFEAPAGYIVDDTAADVYILTQPENQVLDNYRSQFTFEITTVNANYNKTNIRQDLRTRLSEMGQSGYQSWEPSNTAERTLLNAPGYYANYRGIQTDGTIVRGRVHMALLPGNKLLTVHLSNPAEYNSDYNAVFTQLRNTLKTL